VAAEVLCNEALILRFEGRAASYGGEGESDFCGKIRELGKEELKDQVISLSVYENLRLFR
jgi:hypothetical protein